MRKLTIKRHKRMAACAVKMKVYIEDREHSELVINETPCRKLGTLKNGEEAVFEIDGEARRLYVIGDKLSKNYCNDFYELPAGEEDISLSGGNVANPLAGNAYIFDNNNSEEAALNRKGNKWVGVAVMVLAVVAGVIGGIFGYMLVSGMM